MVIPTPYTALVTSAKIVGATCRLYKAAPKIKERCVSKEYSLACSNLWYPGGFHPKVFGENFGSTGH